MGKTTTISTFRPTDAAPRQKVLPLLVPAENLVVLIIGGGKPALEISTYLLSISSQINLRIVDPMIDRPLKIIAEKKDNIEILEKEFSSVDIEQADIIIATIDSLYKIIQAKNMAVEKNKWIHVYGRPDLSDFLFFNNKKPGEKIIKNYTTELPDEYMGDEMQDVLRNLQNYQFGINEAFDEKVRQLNDITKVLLAKQINLKKVSTPATKKWQRIVFFSLFAFLFMILGHTLLSFISFESIITQVKKIPAFVDHRTFLLMVLCGFLAQMADGSLGMGYGTISTTFLLANGVNPAIVSSRVHAARVFSSGVSGYSHHRFGNINKKLFKTLVIPGVFGAVLGATLAFFAQKYSVWVRIPVSIYTMYLGIFIIRKAYKKRNPQNKVKRAGWLATAGGFLDAFAGGGWGSLVTSTLISKRKSPRYVIGSVCLSEFFVVLASSVTFFIFLKSIPFTDVAGLILGGLIAAPIAVRLVGKLPLKIMFLLIGSLVIITSISTIWRVLIHL